MTIEALEDRVVPSVVSMDYSVRLKFDEGMLPSGTDDVQTLQDSTSQNAAFYTERDADNPGVQFSNNSPNRLTLGTSLFFDGTDDRVYGPDCDLINTREVGQRTISLWSQTDTSDDMVRTLYKEGGSQRGLHIYLRGGHVFVGGWNIPQSGSQGTFLSEPYMVGTWHQVVLVQRELEFASGGISGNTSTGGPHL
ncbi:MAG: hypothetical protein ACFCD0_28525 [Gemmataceae bacterium]